jgi:phenylalanyl-tRNA synthetase beta chain
LELPFYPLEKTTIGHVSHELVAPKVKNISGKCLSYQCLLIEKVKAIESPHWLARRMQQAGYRSVNALVDAANWVMLEMGRPIHLFDADTLKGDLEVSLLESEHAFSRIDGLDQMLKPGTLVISDETGPVAVAGVMGSRLHEVGSSTTRVLMEVAVFDSSAVRKSAKAIGCTSEASRRFERGVDPTSNELVFERFIQILKSMDFSPLVGSFSGFSSPLPKEREINLSSKLVYRLLNLRMGAQEISNWLSRLDINCRIVDEETLIAKPSLARHDLVIAQDLVEELMKLIGTENLPRQMLNVHLGSASHDSRYLISQSIRQLFCGRGLKEVITLDMVSGEKCRNFGFENSVELKNPLSVEADVLRPSLLIGFLETLTQNRDQQIKDVGIFEIGSVYSKDGAKTQEQLALGLLITGQKTASHWSQESENFNFYDIKGSVEQLLEYMGAEYCFKTSCFSNFHPGQQAKICSKEGLAIGHVGRLHPRYEKSLGMDYPIFYAEIGIEDLLKVRNSLCQYRALDQYPGSERDWTLTLHESVSFEEVLASFPVLEHLERVELVSIWRCPEKLGFDNKNLTLRFYYRHRDKTMTQSEVESQHLLLKETVSRKLNLKN